MSDFAKRILILSAAFVFGIIMLSFGIKESVAPGIICIVSSIVAIIILFRKRHNENNVENPLTNMEKSQKKYHRDGLFKSRPFNPYRKYNIIKYRNKKSSADFLIRRLKETVQILDTTKKADTFFKNEHYLFDCLLELMCFEDRLFSFNITPEKQFWKQYDYIETKVNNFLDRSYENALQDAINLKTEKAKENRIIGYFDKTLTAFEHCHEFWLGSSLMPHYKDNLYTENNYQKLLEMKSEFMNRLEVERRNKDAQN